MDLYINIYEFLCWLRTKRCANNDRRLGDASCGAF